MPNPFNIREVYSFDVYNPALLKNNFKNVTVLAIMDHETANKEIDTKALHVAIYPHLPAGTPNDPSQYDYVKVKMPNGQKVVLGLAWINTDTITLTESRTVVAKIENVTANDAKRIRDVLLANNFKRVSVTVLN